MQVRTRLLLAPAVAAGLLACAFPAHAEASGQVVSDNVVLTAASDGTLHAKETVTFQGSGVRRSFIRLKHVDDRQDRRFEVADVQGGTVATDTDRTIVTPSGGGPGQHTVKLSYVVRGTMTPLSGRQELNWVAAGGWNVPVAQTQVTVESGAAVQDLNCFAGELDSTVGCTQFFTNHTHVQAEFRQESLQPGEYLTIVIGYPPGTTSGKPMFDQRRTLATAFTVNQVTGAALVGLLVLLLGGIALLYSTRGRDARIVGKKAVEGDHAPVDTGSSRLPDGVRPGQIGTLIDEQADVIDVTATIMDLAVRRYLLIEELSRRDVRPSRLAAAPPGPPRRRPDAVRAAPPRRPVHRARVGTASPSWAARSPVSCRRYATRCTRTSYGRAGSPGGPTPSAPAGPPPARCSPCSASSARSGWRCTPTWR